jgi:hypothetical protein
MYDKTNIRLSIWGRDKFWELYMWLSENIGKSEYNSRNSEIGGYIPFHTTGEGWSISFFHESDVLVTVYDQTHAVALNLRFGK